MSRERGKSCAQIAINFLLQRSERVIPIFGARTLAQLDENLGSTGWELSPEELEALDRAPGALVSRNLRARWRSTYTSSEARHCRKSGQARRQ
jgi:diketogulonate reductase-like aldo/keto reductase